jgi:hypothetical protein
MEMSAQTAATTQQAKAPVPVKQSATGDVFTRIQQTLHETEEESKKYKTVYSVWCAKETG